MEWHGNIDHPGFDPDVASHEARFKGKGGSVKTIARFDGEYRFLSNFAPSVVWHDGIKYPTVEHAYQAAKTFDFAERWRISQLPTPGQAKRAGRRVVLRVDWMQVKRTVMRELLVQKFVLNSELRQKLKDTGTATLIEGNTWGDTFWGVCNGEGRNELGIILMQVRGLLS